ICRVAALRLTIDESESCRQMRTFLKKRVLSFFSSILIILVGVGVCVFPVYLASLLFSVSGIREVIASCFPICLLFGFFAAILLVGLLFGFPLLLSAVAVDGADGFDAVSRTFSYLYQRPFHYIFYWFIAAVFGVFGGMILGIFIDLTILLVQFAPFQIAESMRLGGPPFQTAAFEEVMRQVFQEHGHERGLIWPTAPSNLYFWVQTFYLLLPSYGFAWFWTSSVAIYIILRRSVDATPFVEVFRSNPVTPKPLPKIVLDEKGAPVKADVEKVEAPKTETI
ncbi:MAG: hypothetical protein ACRCUY_02725, partial [Thermoguttaceae bacterium]